MSYGFLLNLIHGVKDILINNGSDTNEVLIYINKGKLDKAQFMGMFHATPEFLREFVNLCGRHFKEESNGRS